MIGRLTVLMILFATLGLASPAAAMDGRPPADPAARCAALAGGAFSNLLDAPTHILKADYVAATAGRPAYCAIEGYVAPSVGFGLWLPVQNWNGKYIVRGCGGFCGSVAMDLACPQHIRDGYACLHSDMGHRSTMYDGKWAYNNLQAEVDFGYRATHVSTLAGKAITAAFYGQAPRYSYFMACSTGGRQGMVEAQRFPDDFDGIVAIAPVLDETGASIQLVWSTVVNRAPDGGEILTAAKVPLLHAAAIKACDLTDGAADGVIGDPRACHFDPGVLQCAGPDRADCLTGPQVAVGRKIYAGPHDSKGRALYTGGAMPGSELNWIGPYISKDGAPAIYADMQAELWRYMGFSPDPGPSWQITDFDFDRDPKRVGLMEAIYSASNPDLRKFKAAGGKLIMAQGWADQSIVPLNAVDYYELATRTMGGPEATTGFFRFFMVPGMNHCSGGEGAYGIDYLAALEAWVERREAPDPLIGIHPRPGSPLDFFRIDFKLVRPDQVAFSRPHFAYPRRAVYAGRGDPNLASSWVATSPPVSP
ncbi:tannase/feruloyl esterase family alpha/beta hydrolase [Phenylobacterium sp.]|uniref:tannase/feruloyl esterase family alpha/beta hydrolase n=1 Tax=Phenylobacterium sp. TaxID=1871053 RepID=UPI0025F5A068|nr:tannase/feruloyl esterase family alpha/beta hydrolase [Phenylobacterium sp.]